MNFAILFAVISSPVWIELLRLGIRRLRGKSNG